MDIGGAGVVNDGDVVAAGGWGRAIAGPVEGVAGG